MRRAPVTIDTLAEWIETNGVQLNNVAVVPLEEGRGNGVIVTRATNIEKDQRDSYFLISVPRCLILGKETAYAYAKEDKHLAVLFDAMGEFAEVRKSPQYIIWS
jgi:hypothetical protein